MVKYLILLNDCNSKHQNFKIVSKYISMHKLNFPKAFHIYKNLNNIVNYDFAISSFPVCFFLKFHWPISLNIEFAYIPRFLEFLIVVLFPNELYLWIIFFYNVCFLKFIVILFANKMCHIIRLKYVITLNFLKIFYCFKWKSKHLIVWKCLSFGSVIIKKQSCSPK